MTSNEESTSLSGRVALITGGTKGIGRAIAGELVAKGVKVTLGFLRDAKSADQAQLELGAACSVAGGDVASPQVAHRLVHETVTKWGRLDIIVHGAVHPASGAALVVSAEDWVRSFAVAPLALVELCRAAAPYLTAHGMGRVIALTGRGAVRAIEHYSALGVPKAAIDSLVRYLAAELGRQGVTVNAVSPGTLDTEALRAVFPNASELLAASHRRMAVPRPLRVEDVARVVAFLVSEAGSMVQGQIISVDAGLSLT